ncbi:dephospho-CoA kinase [Caloranaerobacter azorensis DSM 13643]|uniref:Dephospho-CoA kinase n=1 Tax=Caloranaerobacter azorensis DSM 13643 TaxID=1121264 RepID=A0A1M5WEK2_9FIRM|nr:dephospho-CoA kinase [Caloranaerobacter azorensis]SHH85922.1 dephospho-CoA kinase [Caloranaerobacter azorensis DSM 13643]
MRQNKKKYTKIIGLTGGIATGKSTVTRLLREFGYVVIDADKIAKEVVDVGKRAYLDIVKEFGEDILDENNEIDRKRLGEIIFKDEKKRKKLNQIVHPIVIQEMIDKIEQFSDDKDVIFLDIPLLIEEKNMLEKQGLKFDEIWLVYADEEKQLSRLIKRDKLDMKSALNRIRAQMPMTEKLKVADVIIDNNRGINELKNQIMRLLNRY